MLRQWHASDVPLVRLFVVRLRCVCGSLQGPLAWALFVWRCSLVFSSVDKIVSVLIHLLPGNSYSHS